MLQPTYFSGLSKNLSASALIYTGSCCVQGIVVNSNSSGTLKLWDNTSAATTILFNTITFGATQAPIPLFGAKTTVGLYATIGGTADITIIYQPYQG
jgi:hypothetical protein